MLLVRSIRNADSTWKWKQPAFPKWNWNKLIKILDETAWTYSSLWVGVHSPRLESQSEERRKMLLSRCASIITSCHAQKTDWNNKAIQGKRVEIHVYFGNIAVSKRWALNKLHVRIKPRILPKEPPFKIFKYFQSQAYGTHIYGRLMNILPKCSTRYMYMYNGIYLCYEQTSVLNKIYHMSQNQTEFDTHNIWCSQWSVTWISNSIGEGAKELYNNENEHLFTDFYRYILHCRACIYYQPRRADRLFSFFAHNCTQIYYWYIFQNVHDQKRTLLFIFFSVITFYSIYTGYQTGDITG